MTMAEKHGGCRVFVRLELRKRRSLNKKMTPAPTHCNGDIFGSSPAQTRCMVNTSSTTQ